MQELHGEVDQGLLALGQAGAPQGHAVGDDIGSGHVPVGDEGLGGPGGVTVEQLVAPDLHLRVEDGLARQVDCAIS